MILNCFDYHKKEDKNGRIANYLLNILQEKSHIILIPSLWKSYSILDIVNMLMRTFVVGTVVLIFLSSTTFLSQSIFLTLAVVFIQQKEIHYYDSTNGDGNKCKNALLQWLIDEARNKNSTFDASEWELKSIKDCPQQHNGYDYGVFTIMCANFLFDNLPILETSYGQRNMALFRMKIACDILHGSYRYPID